LLLLKILRIFPNKVVVGLCKSIYHVNTFPKRVELLYVRQQRPMRLAKDLVAFCSGTMLHKIVVDPRTLNVEKHFAALLFFDWFEVTKLIPII